MSRRWRWQYDVYLDRTGEESESVKGSEGSWLRWQWNRGAEGQHAVLPRVTNNLACTCTYLCCVHVCWIYTCYKLQPLDHRPVVHKCIQGWPDAHYLHNLLYQCTSNLLQPGIAIMLYVDIGTTKNTPDCIVSRSHSACESKIHLKTAKTIFWQSSLQCSGANPSVRHVLLWQSRSQQQVKLKQEMRPTTDGIQEPCTIRETV